MNTPSPPHPATPWDRLFPLLFVALWSTGFIGAKFGLPSAEPLTFLSVRYAVVLLLMGAIAVLSGAPWPRAPKEWFHIGVAGLLVHAVYLGGVFSAIALGLPAGIAALVVGLQPVLTALGAGVLLGERVRRETGRHSFGTTNTPARHISFFVPQPGSVGSVSPSVL